MDRICANPWCKQSFRISDRDLAFYEKISPVFNGKKEAIPPPTQCPECREQRRLTFRNERHLYVHVPVGSEKSFISYLSSDQPYTVFPQMKWWSDEWDALEYGMNVDFQQSFLRQFNVLLHRVPRMNLLIWQSEHCDFCNFVDFCNECYLTFGASNCEKVFYSNLTDSCRSCLELCGCKECKLSYDSIDCVQCYNVIGSIRCKNSVDLRFCFDCKNCESCIGCSNLLNARYFIDNTAYTKEEFNRRKQSMDLQHAQSYRLKKEHLLHTIRLNAIHRASNIISCEGCSGDNLTNAKNSMDCYESNNLEDCRWTNFSMNCKDAFDVFGSSKKGVELTYEGMCVEGKNIVSGFYIAGHDNIYYSDFVVSCSNVFGCAGLKQKRYCILNKQYSKEEYEDLVPQIIAKMRADGEWGEFFPVTMSPFAYNETVAQEYFPLTKEEAMKRGWKWRDQTDEIPKVDKIIPSAQLPDSIDFVPDDILHWAIECDVTKRPFRIIKQELDFYRTMRLPVPRLHPDERHRRRMALRNPRKLWNRECGKCGKGATTSYAPERTEKVYCEECYLKEVY